MARKTVFVSDLTGDEIKEGTAAHVQIILDSKPDVRFYLEAQESEIDDLIGASRAQKKRGRKAKVAAAA